MSTGIPNREAAGLIAGFGLWALAFVALYGAHGLACAVDARPVELGTTTRIVLATILAVMLLAHVSLVVRFRRRLKKRACGPEVRFVRLAAYLLAVASTVATAWIGLPVLALTVCT